MKTLKQRLIEFKKDTGGYCDADLDTIDAIVNNRKLATKIRKELYRDDTQMSVNGSKTGDFKVAQPLIKSINELDKAYIELCTHLGMKAKERKIDRADADDFSKYRS